MTHFPPAIRIPDNGNRLSLVAISGNVRRPPPTSGLLMQMREAVVDAFGKRALPLVRALEQRAAVPASIAA